MQVKVRPAAVENAKPLLQSSKQVPLLVYLPTAQNQTFGIERNISSRSSSFPREWVLLWKVKTRPMLATIPSIIHANPSFFIFNLPPLQPQTQQHDHPTCVCVPGYAEANPCPFLALQTIFAIDISSTSSFLYVGFAVASQDSCRAHTINRICIHTNPYFFHLIFTS